MKQICKVTPQQLDDAQISPQLYVQERRRVRQQLAKAGFVAAKSRRKPRAKKKPNQEDL